MKKAVTKNTPQDPILKKLGEIEHEIKLLDQKNSSTERSLNARITSEGAKIRQELKKSLGVEIQLGLHEIEERLQEKLTAFSDRLFTMIDPILKEVVNSREDRVIASAHSEEMRDQLDNHEKRIAKLEGN